MGKVLSFSETSRVDYVLFEAAGLIKDGLIREWASISKEDVRGLRAYLLQYVISRVTLSGYVRERLVQVMAIIVKRQSVEDLGEDRRMVLAEVQQTLIAKGNLQMQMVGCSILGALMQEYATTVKSSDVGLPWEVHFRAKKQFELTDLKAIFEFCVQALKEIFPGLPSAPPLAPEMNNLVLRLTTLAENVLSWTFINVNLPKKLISVFESDQNPSLRPGAPWKETILQPSIAQLFFQVRILLDNFVDTCCIIGVHARGHINFRFLVICPVLVEISPASLMEHLRESTDALFSSVCTCSPIGGLFLFLFLFFMSSLCRRSSSRSELRPSPLAQILVICALHSSSLFPISRRTSEGWM